MTIEEITETATTALFVGQRCEVLAQLEIAKAINRVADALTAVHPVLPPPRSAKHRCTEACDGWRCQL